MARIASGSGDGVITEDGCAVELYRMLQAGGEIAMISSLVRHGATILDLGSGAGRLANPLAGLGYQVTAVDQSDAMLAELAGAERVTSSIETLELGQRQFECVLLSSYLLNTPDADQRAEMLRCCRRYVADDGAVVLQVRGEQLLEDVSGLDREVDGIRDVVESYSRSGLLVSMTVRTEAGGRRWTQSFTHQFLGEEALIAELSREGLRFDRWIDRSFEWCLARPE